jgi:hypothetical protein
VTISREALSLLIESAEVRRGQWDAVAKGGDFGAVFDELYEADAAEGELMRDMYDVAITTGNNALGKNANMPHSG